MKYDVNLNATVDIPDDEVEALETEAEETGDDFDFLLEQYLESNLDLSFVFGDAWVCSVDSTSLIGA